MKLWRVFISLELTFWLLALLCTVMASGSFALTGEYAASINSMPLFGWLRGVSFLTSWWLWLTLVLLVLLAANTVLCSSDTLWLRWGRGGWSALLAPQLIHIGFLLIVLAHLMSAIWASHHSVETGEMSLVTLPDGSRFGVASITVDTSPEGMPVGFRSEIVPQINRPEDRITISPNHPWFLNGFGIYIKQAEEYPFKRALLEIHREPGAAMALAGSVFFMAGNIMLLFIRSKQRE